MPRFLDNNHDPNRDLRRLLALLRSTVRLIERHGKIGQNGRFSDGSARLAGCLAAMRRRIALVELMISLTDHLEN